MRYYVVIIELHSLYYPAVNIKLRIIISFDILRLTIECAKINIQKHGYTVNMNLSRRYTINAAIVGISLYHISCRREARLFLLLSVEEGWNRASVGFVGLVLKSSPSVRII